MSCAASKGVIESSDRHGNVGHLIQTMTEVEPTALYAEVVNHASNEDYADMEEQSYSLMQQTMDLVRMRQLCKTADELPGELFR